MARETNMFPLILLGVGAFLLFRRQSAPAGQPSKPMTLSMVMNYPKVPVTESVNGESEYVRFIQRSLNYIFPADNLTEDGIIGPKTKASIVKFQQSWGIYPDGMLNPETDYAIRAAIGMPGYTEQPYTAAPLSDIPWY